MATVHDMHCHLDFVGNGEAVAQDAQAAGTLMFANTVSKASWEQAQSRFGHMSNVFVGYGLHPWWVEDDTSADDILEDLERLSPRYIGEIGLDFGKRHAATKGSQIKVYDHICRWAANRGDKLLSIHSVHAAREALDLLESSGAAESCACIFHWFSGPSDQLKRAIGMGCYFSVGTRSLATGKGREYVKAIPADRLLLETDYPPERGQLCTFEDMREQLMTAAETIATIKGVEAIATTASTSEYLLGKRTGVTFP